MVQWTNKTKRTMRFIQACAEEYQEQFLWKTCGEIEYVGDGKWLVYSPYAASYLFLKQGGEVVNTAGS